MKFSQDFMWAYSNRGFAYLHKGEYDETIKDFTKALEIDPNCGKAQERIERIRERK